jgi:hypothetical protein
MSEKVETITLNNGIEIHILKSCLNELKNIENYSHNDVITIKPERVRYGYRGKSLKIKFRCFMHNLKLRLFK